MNTIGDEGAKAIGERLKVNTSLTALNLACPGGGKYGKEKGKKGESMTGNQIGDEGANAMSEMLKVNTSLTSLNLHGEEERKKRTIERKKKGGNE